MNSSAKLIKVIYKCIRCNDSMEDYGVSVKGEMIAVGLVCMKEGCDRRGLLAVTAKREEIIT